MCVKCKSREMVYHYLSDLLIYKVLFYRPCIFTLKDGSFVVSAQVVCPCVQNMHYVI